MPTISFLMPSVRPYMWSECYNYLKKTNLPFELIICTPCDIPSDISHIDNITFIKTNVKPVQCWQIAAQRATGEFLSLMADDIEISPYAFDEAVRIHQESNDYKTIVSLMFYGKNSAGAYVSEMDSLLFPDSGRPEKCIQLPCGLSIISRKYFMEMGGYDRNFMQEELDLFVRCMVDGAQVFLCQNGRSYEDRGKQLFGNGINRDDRNFSWKNDYYLLRQLWSDNDIEDWKNNLANIKRSRPFEPFDMNAPDFTTKTQGITLPKWD